MDERNMSGANMRGEVIVPKPKRPQTAYNFFFKETQENLKVAKSCNKVAKIAKLWNALLPSERTKYFHEAAEDKLRYYSEKSRYDDYLKRIESQDPARYKTITAKGKRSKGIKQPPVSIETDPVYPIRSGQEPATLLAGDLDRSQIMTVPGSHLSPGNDPYCSPESIALLASKLDATSINFLIRAFK